MVLLMSFLAGCELFPAEEPLLAPPLMEPVEVSYSTVQAKRGDIVKTIRGSGSLVSVESKYMFFEARGGRLKEIHAKLGDVIKKGDLLAELYTDDIESQIKQQELSLKKAKISYTQMKESGADKYELEKASIDIEIADIRLDELKEQRDQAKLVSDVDGVITYVDMRIGPGDNISAFQNIMKIADPRSLYLAYTGSNMNNFNMGTEVDVLIKDKTYKGKVISTPANVPEDGDENLKNYVGIEVTGLPEDVQMGDNAQISLTLEESKDTIILPKQAVRNYMGRKYVNVLENGLNNERDVEIGIETSTDVEILKGVEEGEEIILR
jgi:RND family efflux transporter MFP subunit